MNDNEQSGHTHQLRRIQKILLVLALLTSPILCCGSLQLLDALPSAWLPESLDFAVNLFEGEALVTNNTSQTLYVTAVTTAYGEPMVIPQNITFRQRDIPIEPQASVALSYDAADTPLAGIVVCKIEDDCRLLLTSSSSEYTLNSYDDLERVEASWLEAIHTQPQRNYSGLVIILCSLLPIFLFWGWLHLRRRERLGTG